MFILLKWCQNQQVENLISDNSIGQVGNLFLRKETNLQPV